jgi:hypothetical protein
MHVLWSVLLRVANALHDLGRNCEFTWRSRITGTRASQCNSGVIVRLRTTTSVWQKQSSCDGNKVWSWGIQANAIAVQFSAIRLRHQIARLVSMVLPVYSDRFEGP